MLRRGPVLLLALLIGVSSPALLPAEWSTAFAKRSRQKVRAEKPKRSTASKTETAAPPPVVTVPAPLPFTGPVIVTLSTDRAGYKTGDLMTIAVVVDTACNLTLVSIDGDGFATVVFPNEFEPNNAMTAGVPLTIPRIGAAYQLRAKRPGTETLLGICTPPGMRPRGISADYERYRFTLLGEWPEFTTTIPQREIDIIKIAAEEKRRHSRRAPPLAPLPPPSDPSGEGRSVLLVPVTEGPL